MLEAVRSVAVIKTNIDEGIDFIDNFIPFIASMAHEKKYIHVEIGTIQQDFLDCYGLKIPYHALKSILGRCIRKKIIESNHEGYNFSKDVIEDVSFCDLSKKKEEQFNMLIESINEYADTNFSMTFSDDEITNVMIKFLKKYDTELLIENDLFNFEPVTNQQNDYIFNNFVVFSYTNKPELYKILVEMAVGYLFASSIFFGSFEKNKNSIKDIRLYLDTRFLLRLIGLEGEELSGYYKTLIVLLKKNEAKLRIFKHTLGEIEHILDECSRLIDKDETELDYIGSALQFFIEENYKRSDIILFKAQLEKMLSEYGIRIVEIEQADEKTKCFIDEIKLEKDIYEIYHIQDNSFFQWKKKNSILRDIKSISLIRQLRNCLCKSIKRSKHIFITTNYGLAKASKKYTFEENNDYYFPECVTDVYLGTFVWLENPPVIEELQYKKLITDSISYLTPNNELIKLYIDELKLLKDRDEITEDEYYFLRTHSVIRKLENKTCGDPSEFSDKLPQELLYEFRSKIVKPVEEKYSNMLGEKEDEIAKLSTSIDIKDSQIKEKDSKLLTLDSNVKKLSSFITITVTILISIFVSASLILSFFNITNLALKITVSSVLGIITFLNLFIGFTFKLFYKKLNGHLVKKLNILLFNMRDTA